MVTTNNWDDEQEFQDNVLQMKRDQRRGILKFGAMAILFTVAAAGTIGLGMAISNVAGDALGDKNRDSDDVSKPDVPRRGDRRPTQLPGSPEEQQYNDGVFRGFQQPEGRELGRRVLLQSSGGVRDGSESARPSATRR